MGKGTLELSIDTLKYYTTGTSFSLPFLWSASDTVMLTIIFKHDSDIISSIQYSEGGFWGDGSSTFTNGTSFQAGNLKYTDSTLRWNNGFYFGSSFDLVDWHKSTDKWNTTLISSDILFLNISKPQSAVQFKKICEDFYSFPNPFLSHTQISFTSSETGYAEISIVNALGTEVSRLYEGELEVGDHSFIWDPAGSSLPFGNYWCVARMDGRVQMLPMAMLK